MSNIAFFGSVYRGHNVAPKSLVDMLTERKHKVIYFAPEKYSGIISTSATYIPYPHFQSLDLLMNAKLPTGDIFERLKFLTEATVNASIDIAEWAENLISSDYLKIDIIIHDNMAIWGYVIGKKLNIINACSVTLMATNTDAMRIIANKAIYLQLPQSVSEPLGILHKQGIHGIKSFVDIMTCEYHDNIILYTSSYFQSYQSYLPKPKYIYFSDRCTDPSIKQKGLSEELNIYLSFGTIYNNDIELYTAILDSIANKNYKISVSAGDNQHTFSILKDRYAEDSSIKILDFVNQLEILQQTDIFITHAGMNSATEAICNLVAMITIPLVGDQHDVSDSLARLGAAYVVPKDKVNEQINIAIANIADNFALYQDSLRKIKESFVDPESINEAITSIENLFVSPRYFNDEL